MSHDRAIALVGMMGSGKTTVANILAGLLGGRVLDLDHLLVAEAGCSVAEIFRREGEAGFRRREASRLAELLLEPPTVLACGGGAILDPDSRDRLKRACRVVWLEVSPHEAMRRVGHNAERRPLLTEAEAGLEALLRGREDAYRDAADLRVPTDGRTPAQVAQAVVQGLREGSVA